MISLGPMGKNEGHHDFTTNEMGICFDLRHGVWHVFRP